MVEKLNIGIDLDDVVTDTLPDIMRFHMFNTGAPSVALNDWDAILYLKEIDGEHERLGALLNYYANSGQFGLLRPIAGAVDGIKQLLSSDNVYFLTARGSRGISDTYRWLEQHDLPYDRVFFDRDKVWHAQRLGLDIMVDDGVHNLERIKKALLSINTVLFERPWNKKDFFPEQYAHWRAHDWDEVLRIVSVVRDSHNE